MASRAKTINRVRALRALAANNNSKEEARRALELSAALMEQYQLTEADVERDLTPAVPEGPSGPPYPQESLGDILTDLALRAGVRVSAHYAKATLGIDLEKVIDQLLSEEIQGAKTETEKEAHRKTAAHMKSWLK